MFLKRRAGQAKLFNLNFVLQFLTWINLSVISTGSVALAQTQAQTQSNTQTWAQVTAVKHPTINASAVFAISGGANPSANHMRYYLNLDRIQNLFKGRPIYNFVAGGSETEPVTVTMETESLLDPLGKTTIRESMKLNEYGLPILRAQKVSGGIAGAAAISDVRQSIGKWSQTNSNSSSSQHPVMIYVTDHGTQLEGKGVVSLWNKEHLNAVDLNQIIQQIPVEQKIVMVFDQCYGGNMLDAMWDASGNLRPNICGFSSSSPGQVATSGGGFMRLLQDSLSDSKKSYSTFSDFFSDFALDPQIKSQPILSSDVFANRWMQEYSIKTHGTHLGAIESDPTKELHLLCPASTETSSIPEVAPVVSLELATRTSTQIQKLQHKIKARYAETTKIQDVLAELKLQEETKNVALDVFNKHSYEFLNPMMTELVQENYPFYPSFKILKEKKAEGSLLSEEESLLLKKHINEIALIKTAIEDEASMQQSKLLKKYAFKIDKEKLKIFTINKIFFARKAKALFSYYKSKGKWQAANTLIALQKMMESGDEKALANYFSIIECENTALFYEE